MMKAVQRVSEHAKRLDKPLLHGMGGRGCGGNVRSRPLASLIAEETALDAVHHRGSQPSTGNRSDTKGVLYDYTEDMRNELDVHGDDDKRKNHIPHRHQRDENAAHFCNALNAAEDDCQREYRKHYTHPERVYGKGFLHGTADGIALYGDISHAESHGDEYGKELRHPPAVHAVQDIISRAADERVGMTTLIKLGKRRFDESCR